MKTEIEILKEYAVKAHEFASYKDIDYPQHALFSETGELSGKFSKRKRGDIVPESDITAEIGDCWWMVVEILSNNKLWPNMRKLSAGPFRNENDMLERLGTFSLQIFSCKSDVLELGMLAYISTLLHFVDYFNYDLQTILDQNIEKLTDRKNRGVINGKGDHR